MIEMTEQEQEPIESHEGEAMNEDLLAGARALEEGAILAARVVQVQDDVVFVDVGWKSDLPITREEISLTPVASAKEAVQTGEEIRVMVIKNDEDEGIQLSKKAADLEYRWTELAEAAQNGATVTGRVKEKTKGGLVVDVGLRGFVPASQASLEYMEDLAPCVGETWDMKVLEVDRGARRIVLSRKAILAEERARAQAEVLGRLKEGDVIEGKVVRLASFGAFIDLGAGVEGLLHVSEIAWERVNNPADRLATGETLRVLITKIDPEAQRISLSLRQLHPHPWSGVAERFPVGKAVTGKVVRLAPFGAFVRLAEGIDGLVHISQMADRRVNRPEDVVGVGQEVSAKVIKVDEENRRLSLSMRAIAEEAEEERVKSFLHGQESPALTIADLIKAKQGKAEGGKG